MCRHLYLYICTFLQLVCCMGINSLQYKGTQLIFIFILQIQDGVWTVFVAALVLIAARQGESPEKLPRAEQMDALVQFPPGSVSKMEGQIRTVLSHDTAAISAIRVVKLYFERLGYNSKVCRSFKLRSSYPPGVVKD